MVSLALFEDSHWQNFVPITLTKPTFDVKVGAKSYFEEYERPPEFLVTREPLAATTRLKHTSSLVNPHAMDADTVFINGLLHPGAVNLDKMSNVSHTFVITCGQRLLVGRLGKKGGEYLADCVETGKKINLKKIETEKSNELGLQDAEGLLSNPWDIISHLENSLSLQTARPERSNSAEVPQSVRVLGQGQVVIENGAEIEDGAVLDASKGGIFIGSQAHIAPSRIIGPAYIDRMSQLKQFTIVESSYIGYNCRIAGEVEHSIVSDHTNKAHAGFLGHSYVGEWVNIGAMTTTSDLKMTYGNIKMDDIGGAKVNTGSNKIGSFMGDMCKTSIGTLIYSGRRIGVSSHLHGLVSKDVPSFTIYGSSIGASNVELQLESAIETQKRVMSRRNQKMSKAYEEMMEHVFAITSQDRKKAKVRRGKFSV
jgi:UDP-N-acetylglucosamine diphosphorylase/glucosamine-1-phosphate N-acetyltransferase